MLFTKPLSSIEFSDVVQSCDAGNDESFIIEYKRDVPDNDKIAKAVAAFAYTHGGLLIIGIDARKTYSGIRWHRLRSTAGL